MTVQHNFEIVGHGVQGDPKRFRCKNCRVERGLMCPAMDTPCLIMGHAAQAQAPAVDHAPLVRDVVRRITIGCICGWRCDAGPFELDPDDQFAAHAASHGLAPKSRTPYELEARRLMDDSGLRLVRLPLPPPRPIHGGYPDPLPRARARR